MPVSIRTDPFRQQQVCKGRSLRTPQARVLVALVPTYPNDPVSEWPSMTATRIAMVTGISPRSDCIRRALRGLPEGSSSGDAHEGLLARLYVESVKVDVDGVLETYYQMTRAGMHALQNYLADRQLPQVRPASMCVNKRYNGNKT